MKKYIVDYATLFGIAGVIIILDQWTKELVRTNVPLGHIWPPDHWITDYARVIHWTNTGAAFGMFQNLSVIFTILPFIVAGVIVYYFPRVPRRDWTLRLAMSLQLGGAVGNLIDRLQHGHVTDFIMIWNFPVFNIADLSITLGVIILFLGLWINEREDKKEESSEVTEEQGTTVRKEISSSNLPEEIQGE